MSIADRLLTIARSPISTGLVGLVLVGSLLLAAIPLTHASHITSAQDLRYNVQSWTGAHFNGTLLGDVNPEATGANAFPSTPYDLTFSHINATPGVTRVAIVSPNGTMIVSTDLGTGSNMTTRNATFVIQSSTLVAAGIYTLRELDTSNVPTATIGAIYLQPRPELAVTVSPNPATAPSNGGAYIVTYHVSSTVNGSGVPNASIHAPGVPSPAMTDANGDYVVIQTLGPGTYGVEARKQTSPQATNGIDVPELVGTGSYTVNEALPLVRIGHVAGSILHPVVTPIRIENISDFGSATVTLAFDSDVVAVASVGNSSIPNATVTWDVNDTTGVLTVLVTTTARPGVSGSFDLVDVTLQAVGNAGDDTSLDLTLDELVDSDGADMNATVVDGSFRAGLLGDADGDGDVDTDDVQAIADAVVGLRSMGTIVAADADVSADGIVSGRDSMMIAQFLAGTRASLG